MAEFLCTKTQKCHHGSWWILSPSYLGSRQVELRAKRAEEKLRDSGQKKKLVNRSSGARRALQLSRPSFVAGLESTTNCRW
jgi:hypothetical protein